MRVDLTVIINCESFERNWLRTDLNVISFGLIGWLAPSSIPTINGKSLTGLFVESIGQELTHFPTPPPATSQFWLWLVTVKASSTSLEYRSYVILQQLPSKEEQREEQQEEEEDENESVEDVIFDLLPHVRENAKFTKVFMCAHMCFPSPRRRFAFSSLYANFSSSLIRLIDLGIVMSKYPQNSTLRSAVLHHFSSRNGERTETWANWVESNVDSSRSNVFFFYISSKHYDYVFPCRYDWHAHFIIIWPTK
ncbi:hypothetical protein HS088_TW01G00410 [Tripterygium wilfordii]|uniref:Uncharacterized protein n=1 Tax=Tripterygium wilfordii TaxID=458696 RepID=A0A7J7E1M2_TRIWF|nr:hypothetical protein HS088_TW01G00410 [Tripterygium wilfordii]